MKKLTKLLSCAFVVLIAGVIMTGCMPMNVDKAKSKMEKAGYQISEFHKADSVEGYVGSFIAIKFDGSEGNQMVAILFKSAKDASVFVNSWAGEYDGKDKYCAGKWVYSGSDTAISIFTS